MMFSKVLNLEMSFQKVIHHICYAALWRLQMRESSGERTSGGNGLSDFVDLGHKSCSAVKQR